MIDNCTMVAAAIILSTSLCAATGALVLVVLVTLTQSQQP
jgi:hypothetical protein